MIETCHIRIIVKKPPANITSLELWNRDLGAFLATCEAVEATGQTMNRTKALGKLSTICQRLDAVNPDEFFVIPLRLYLFGSLLTNKANPMDIDLLFQYKEHKRSERDIDEMLYEMAYGKPLPHDKAISHLRKGMQMVRIELLSDDSSPEHWIQSHEFEPDTPFRLVWERGLDWKKTLQDMDANPLDWSPATEQRHKYFQETAKQIRKDQGLMAAVEWLEQQKKGSE